MCRLSMAVVVFSNTIILSTAPDISHAKVNPQHLKTLGSSCFLVKSRDNVGSDCSNMLILILKDTWLTIIDDHINVRLTMTTWCCPLHYLTGHGRHGWKGGGDNDVGYDRDIGIVPNNLDDNILHLLQTFQLVMLFLWCLDEWTGVQSHAYWWQSPAFSGDWNHAPPNLSL